ncbi:MAG: hypothetical protein ACT4O9_16145 [Blastocatellia bacterium]
MGDGYTLDMEMRGEYLWVLAGGEKLSAEIATAYWTEIAEKCSEENCRKILIEKDFPESVEPGEMLQMADKLGQLLRESRIAFIDRHDHEDINELGKKLARNRNVLMQLFNNVKDAEKWLLAN